MMRRDDASERQVRASNPGVSTWLSANAGSGKTRVLTDRVARLLLRGTQPQHILCLTYTKAAAAEMQNRLFRRLGKWAMLEDPALRAELAELGEEGAIDADRLAQARRLFARAIETPGGLKIQTIHSFCAGILRRFPLEAGVTPGFRELDDQTTRRLQEDILDEMALDSDVTALDAIAQLGSENVAPLLSAISRAAEAFDRPLPRDALAGLLGIPADLTIETLVSEVLLGGEAEVIADLIPLLRASGPNDRKLGAALTRLRLDRRDHRLLAALEDIFLTGPGAKSPFSAKVGSLPTKGLANGAAASLMPRLEALMLRIEAARPTRLALFTLDRTAALHRFASAFLPRLRARKAARGWLDFDDLIRKAAALLSDRSVAAWVLFRLDGGIDHILVDEAQDTAPLQWTVIERLAEEFTAGEGARGTARTIFVVGDKKQSIYSFQGADLSGFDRMAEHFARRFETLPAGLQRLQLEHSFRSSHAILRLVDDTFIEPANRGLGGRPSHVAFRDAMPGRVDLWAAIPKTETPEKVDWFDPVDILSPEHEIVLLARKIAQEIRRIIEAGTQCEVRDGSKTVIRPLHEGDFMILVQRRSELFSEIIRACKQEGLAIAGADRLKLGAELAVRDLRALLSFLATPDDSLSLAAALRSPLFGWSEAALHGLAQPRDKGQTLWAALRNRTDCPETLAILHDLRDKADFLRPYDLIERVLIRHRGRASLLARLGSEAEDGIDELLSQALAYEQTDVPSLTGFLVWLEGDDVEVKRRLDSDARAIRVMTVHGAKGLEAPVVILPDTTPQRGDEQVRDEILTLDGTPMWRVSKDDMPPAMAAARDEALRLGREERMRLLYVAMTRAESWLIVCAAGDLGKTPEDSWYGLVEQGMIASGAVNALPDGKPLPFGPGLRLTHGEWPEPAVREKAPDAVLPALPAWANLPAPSVPEAEGALRPSDLGGAKAIGGAEGAERDAAMRAGTWLHLLLEHLPLHDPALWSDVSRRLLTAAEEPATEAEAETVLAQAAAVLDCAALTDLAGDRLAEVEVTGRIAALGGRVMHGTIDLLVIQPDRILAIDYKTNATVPATPEETPEGILRQMAAYADLLGQIYTDRPVEVAILWTANATLMPLPPDILRAALGRSTMS